MLCSFRTHYNKKVVRPLQDSCRSYYFSRQILKSPSYQPNISCNYNTCNDLLYCHTTQKGSIDQPTFWYKHTLNNTIFPPKKGLVQFTFQKDPKRDAKRLLLLPCILYTEKIGQLLNYHSKRKYWPYLWTNFTFFLPIKAKILKYFTVFHFVSLIYLLITL